MIGVGVALLVLLALAGSSAKKAGGADAGPSPGPAPGPTPGPTPGPAPGPAPTPGKPSNTDINQIAEMPQALREQFAAALRALTVDPTTGLVTGPVKAEAVQLATATASVLERAGWPGPANVLRTYATAAAKLVATGVVTEKIPGIPADLQEQVNRALSMERDPAKLKMIVAALKALPQSQQRDDAIAMMEALVVQVEAQIATKEALDKIHATVSTPVGQPPPPVAPARRMYTPKAGDTGEKIALLFTGNKARWRELLVTNPTLASKQYGIAIYVDRPIVIPDAWPTLPGITPTTTPVVTSTPVTTTPVVTPVITPVTTTPAGARMYTPLPGEFGTTVAKKFTGDPNRWRELLTVNPTLASVKYGIAWRQGQSILLPANWPSVPTGSAPAAPMATSVPSQPTVVPTTATPQPEPLVKTPAEMAADALVKNLAGVQARFGMPGAKGKEDLLIVKRFQSLTGDSAPDGKAGPGVLAKAAQQGQVTLPLVMYWPKSATSAKVIEYRSVLNKLADAAQAAGNLAAATELRASAARERGQAGIVGPMPPG